MIEKMLKGLEGIAEQAKTAYEEALKNHGVDVEKMPVAEGNKQKMLIARVQELAKNNDLEGLQKLIKECR